MSIKCISKNVVADSVCYTSRTRQIVNATEIVLYVVMFLESVLASAHIRPLVHSGVRNFQQIVAVVLYRRQFVIMFVVSFWNRHHHSHKLPGVRGGDVPAIILLGAMLHQ